MIFWTESIIVLKYLAIPNARFQRFIEMWVVKMRTFHLPTSGDTPWQDKIPLIPSVREWQLLIMSSQLSKNKVPAIYHPATNNGPNYVMRANSHATIRKYRKNCHHSYYNSHPRPNESQYILSTHVSTNLWIQAYRKIFTFSQLFWRTGSLCILCPTSL